MSERTDATSPHSASAQTTSPHTSSPVPDSIRGAVHRGTGNRLEVLELRLAEPGPGSVLVRMGASGVCGSDRHVLEGEWSMPQPTVLGHEGAGTVEAVGEGVDDLQPGDHVVLTWFYPCERCDACRQGRSWACTGSRSEECLLPDGSTPMTLDGETAYPYLAVGSMAEWTVVPRQAAVKIPDEVPFDVAALIGCSVATGFGAVVNDAHVAPGRSAVVIGAGGVGLCLVMALALSGASPIIAVDTSDDSLELARSFGATHTVRADSDVTARVREITGTGADYAFEAIGRVETIELLPGLLTRGGTAVAVGLPPQDSPVRIDMLAFAEEGKTFIGSNYGATVPARDFPMLARLYLAGKLPVDRLITERVPLERVNDAFDTMRRGARGRTVIVY